MIAKFALPGIYITPVIFAAPIVSLKVSGRSITREMFTSQLINGWSIGLEFMKDTGVVIY